MLTTIDSAGRLVLPKALRDQVGIVPGPVDVTVSGAGLRIEPPTSGLVEKEGHLFLPATGQATTVESVRELRLADQR
jgi:bifunctional DNA-binding transcriptional regulator/antitoxin component of YhaV-PrlF toxin-antitoxin module